MTCKCGEESTCWLDTVEYCSRCWLIMKHGSVCNFGSKMRLKKKLEKFDKKEELKNMADETEVKPEEEKEEDTPELA